MIEKMTKAQEKKVPVYLKKWLDNGRKTGKVNKTKAKKAIAQIYECAGMEAPKHYFFFPSPIQCQLACNIMKSKDFEKIMGEKANLRSNLRSNLWSNLENNLWSNLGSNLRSNLRSNLENNLGSNLRSNLWSNLGSNLWSNLENNLWSNLENNLGSNLGSNLRSNLRSNLENNLWSNLGSNLRSNLENNLWSNLGSNLRSNLRSNLENNLWSNLKLEYEYMFWGNTWTYWVGFYDFVLNELFEEKIKEYKSFVKYCEAVQHINVFIPFKDMVFISDYPEELNLNERGQLHALDKPAMVYEDGYALFYSNGIKVPKYFVETKAEDFTKEVIMKETNADIRAQIMLKVGSDNLVKVLDYKTIDKLDDYELITFDIGDGRVRPFLKMTCPSTGKTHVEGAMPNTKTVAEAWAYQHNEQKMEGVKVVWQR